MEAIREASADGAGKVERSLATELGPILRLPSAFHG
jgi:hypothetical protein